MLSAEAWKTEGQPERVRPEPKGGGIDLPPVRQ